LTSICRSKSHIHTRTCISSSSESPIVQGIEISYAPALKVTLTKGSEYINISLMSYLYLKYMIQITANCWSQTSTCSKYIKINPRILSANSRSASLSFISSSCPIWQLNIWLFSQNLASINQLQHEQQQSAKQTFITSVFTSLT